LQEGVTQASGLSLPAKDMSALFINKIDLSLMGKYSMDVNRLWGENNWYDCYGVLEHNPRSNKSSKPLPCSDQFE